LASAQAVLKVYRDLCIALSRRQAGVILQHIRAFVGQAKRLPETEELEIFYREICAVPASHSLTEAPPGTVSAPLA